MLWIRLGGKRSETQKGATLCHFPKLLAIAFSNESEGNIDLRQNYTHPPSFLKIFFFNLGRDARNGQKRFFYKKSKQKKRVPPRERERMNLGLHLSNWVEINFCNKTEKRWWCWMISWLVWSIQNLSGFSLLAGLFPAPLCAGPFLCFSSIRGPWGIHPASQPHWQLAGALLAPRRWTQQLLQREESIVSNSMYKHNEQPHLSQSSCSEGHSCSSCLAQPFQIERGRWTWCLPA